MNEYGERDEADIWLESQGANTSNSTEDSYPDELFGAATASTLQLGRIGHAEPRIQAGIKAILSGQSVYGIHPVDAAAAREEFASIIGGDPQQFASQIKLDEVVQVPRNSRDLKTIVSMLQNTAGDYLDRGPGGQLVNSFPNEEKQRKADDDLAMAVGYVKDLASLYIDPRTIGSPVEGARRKALEESLTKRFIDRPFYEGSSDLLPLPNETGVTGIIATQGIYGSPQGTAEDRLSAGQFSNRYQTVDGGGIRTQYVRDERGYKVFKDEVTQAERNDILRRTPSIQNSLFPAPRLSGQKTYSVEELEQMKRGRAHDFGQAQYKADTARRILRQQMPTTRDESKNQIRMTGWDTPYGEQADLQNLRNEAAILGITWADKYAGQGEGEERSELTDYIEDATKTKPLISGEIKQGTQAWLDLRKGKITASTAAGLLKSGGVEERAMELAMERLGTSIPFTGNAHTREGSEGESKAASAFMAGPGRGLNLKEAFFEENEKYAGFGVSPDGRLYNDEGDSEGLLELKYLSSGSMKGALTKYTPQMQMQMAITGESKTNFYALDKYTGEYIHEVVQANPNMQAELLEAGQSALSMAAGLDNRGVQALRNQIESNKPRQRRGASARAVGQTEAFVVEEDVVQPMTAFVDKAAAFGGVREPSGAASETLLASKLTQIEQNERMKNATNAAKGEEEAVPIVNLGAQQDQRRRDQAKARNAFVAGNTRPAFGDSTDGTSSAMSDFYKRQEEQANEASDSIKNLGESAKKASKVLSDIGKLITGGNASGMSEVRLAAETGQEVGLVRGTREALELGGLDQAGANRTIMQSSNLVKAFNDEQEAANKYTGILQARGRSNLPTVRSMDVPGIRELQGMSPQQMTAMVAQLMVGKSPQARAQIGKIFGMPELTTYDQDPASLMNVDESINGENLRGTSRGIQYFEQLKREGLEEVGEIGEVGGTFGAGTQTVSTIAGSATAGYLGNKLYKSKTGAKFMAQALKTGPKAGNIIKGLSTVGKATPTALVASIAPEAIRYFGDVEDDGGLADSALDVADFASYGAGIGSVVGGAIGFFGAGVGAIPGAAAGGVLGAKIGAGVGLLNEAWEHTFADDAVPDTNIGAMPSQTRQNTGTINQTVNVEVLNEISPELIRTTTNVDGDLNIDEETGLNTGGY